MTTAALLLTLWGACQGLDVATTAYALNSGRFVEANPMMRGPQLYALKVSINVGAFVFQKKAIEPHHQGKWMRAMIPLAAAGSGCLAGSLNLHTITNH